MYVKFCGRVGSKFSNQTLTPSIRCLQLIDDAAEALNILQSRTASIFYFHNLYIDFRSSMSITFLLPAKLITVCFLCFPFFLFTLKHSGKSFSSLTFRFTKGAQLIWKNGSLGFRLSHRRVERSDYTYTKLNYPEFRD